MRIVILGCGTGVGKTRVSTALLRELSARGLPALGSKPVESGLDSDAVSIEASDARALALAGSLHSVDWLPLYHFAAPVSPHLAARGAGVAIETARAALWVSSAELEVAPHVVPNRAIFSIVETAGGVFSPLSETASNFELALALEPATWVLVAADSLGVLHDVSATLQAMGARGRRPDHVVLSVARTPDASTGSNASELAALRICQVSAELTRDDDRGISALVNALLEQQQHASSS